MAPIRRELGIRTVFNILGPLSNPAGANMELMGVFDEALVEPLAQVMAKLGVVRGMVVYGQDKLDEISMSAPTSVCEIRDGWFQSYELTPEQFGYTRCSKEDLVGGTPQENAEITKAILTGTEKGPKRQAVCLNAGASAISCLTEPFYFLGSDRYLKEITENVQIPVLRKDFTVDEYMIYQAKELGASAVLLICAILDDEQLKSYRILAEELGMDALVEAHDEEEVSRALRSGAKIIGVNNRDLRTFQVDVCNSIRLRELASADVVFVSESGIRTSEDIRKLYENQVDAVLIGETLMRSPGKKAMLEELNSGAL